MYSFSFNMNVFLNKLPWGLVLLRLLLAPTVLLTAYYGGTDQGKLIVVLLIVAMLSDLFDGVIARKRNVATPALRKWDSNVDLIFWLATLLAAALLYPELIWEHRLPILVLVLLEAAMYLLSFFRFRKGPANHAYLTKLWGLSVLLSLSSIIGWGLAGIPFVVMFVLGIVAYVDGLVILALLPHWQSDIPSLFHAAKIRREALYVKPENA